MSGERVDRGSRLIRAPAERVFEALLDANAVAVWRPPEGMTAVVHAFEPHVGGRFSMSFVYDDGGAAHHGKTDAATDTFAGTFEEIVSGQRIVEKITFVSDDAAFASPMRVTTSLRQADGGTEVTVEISGVPPGVDPEDHRQGIASSLANLAAFVEAVPEV